MDGKSLELITANVSGSVRKDSLYGRPYLVAPVTLIVPGVLNGSEGPILYTNEENQKSADLRLWNNIPLTKDHPLDDQGNPVSARTAKVLNSVAMGTLLNVFNKNKLGGEAWFDEELTKRVSPSIYNRLLNNEKIELSTGLGLNVINENGMQVARNYLPDHLAILENAKGACSLDDGCGVLNKSQGSPTETNNESNSEEKPMKLNEQERNKLIDKIVSNCSCEESSDKEALNKLSDKTLKTLAGDTVETVTNAEVKDDEEESKPTEKATAKQEASKDKPTQATNEEGSQNPKEGNTPVETNNSDPLDGLTWDHISNLMPQQVKDDLAFAANHRNQQKNDMITKIIDNSALEENDANEFRKILNKKTVEQLNNDYGILLKNAPARPSQEYDFGGGRFDILGTAPVTNSQRNEKKPGHLIPPDPFAVNESSDKN